MENITPRFNEIAPLINMMQEQGTIKFGVTLYYVLHLIRESFEQFPDLPEPDKQLIEMLYKAVRESFDVLGIDLTFRRTDESV